MARETNLPLQLMPTIDIFCWGSTSTCDGTPGGSFSKPNNGRPSSDALGGSELIADNLCKSFSVLCDEGKIITLPFLQSILASTRSLFNAKIIKIELLHI